MPDDSINWPIWARFQYHVARFKCCSGRLRTICGSPESHLPTWIIRDGTNSVAIQCCTSVPFSIDMGVSAMAGQVHVTKLPPIQQLEIKFPGGTGVLGGAVVTTEGIPPNVAQSVDWLGVIGDAIKLIDILKGGGDGGGGSGGKKCYTTTTSLPDGTTISNTVCVPT
jgi:hypothetical protein